MNRFDLANQRKMTLITTILNSWSLMSVVQSCVRNFHRKIHVLNRNLKFLDLNFSVGKSSQALEGKLSFEVIKQPSPHRSQLVFQPLPHLVHTNYSVMQSAIDVVRLRSQITSGVHQNRIQIPPKLNRQLTTFFSF